MCISLTKQGNRCKKSGKETCCNQHLLNHSINSHSEDDLYEERFAVIEWYQQNAPLDFALYGRGWDKPKAGFTRKDKLIRRGKRLASQLFGYKPFPSYRGSVIDKGDIYKNSKFKQALYKINEPGMIQRKRLGEE